MSRCDLRPASSSLATLVGAGETLYRDLLLDEGYATRLTPGGPTDRAVLKAYQQALRDAATYAGAVAILPTLTQRMTSQVAQDVINKARRAERSFTVLAGTAPTLPVVPVRSKDNLVLLQIVPAPRANPPTTTVPETPTPPANDRGVGVPSVYQGRFTSVDRLERCSATADYVYCSAGPSGRAVKLTVGIDAVDFGVRGSQDLGGHSMPEGTSFTTPNGKITCDSSSRGTRSVRS